MPNPDTPSSSTTDLHEVRAAKSVAPLMLLVWGIGLGTIVAVRYRSGYDFYISFHRWLSTNGVPDSVRSFDSLIWLTAAALIGALMVRLQVARPITELLCLRRGLRGWAGMVPAALAPMVLGGLLLGLSRGTFDVGFADWAPTLAPGVIRAPWMEEILFRGLLVAIPGYLLAWRGGHFWLNAILSSLLFGVTHIRWSAEGLASGWPALLVTAIGGIWYSWLLLQWRSIWVPMVLHAGMNLGWAMAAARGGAGGGGWLENTLRVATIAIATFWTIRAARRRKISPADSFKPHDFAPSA